MPGRTVPALRKAAFTDALTPGTPAAKAGEPFHHQRVGFGRQEPAGLARERGEAARCVRAAGAVAGKLQ